MSKHGTCALCGRETFLTFHHLVPRAVASRKSVRRRFSKDERGAGIDICRRCHNGIHDLYDEKTLARRFHSLEKLLADPAIRKHVAWVAKQKT